MPGGQERLDVQGEVDRVLVYLHAKVVGCRHKKYTFPKIAQAPIKRKSGDLYAFFCLDFHATLAYMSEHTISFRDTNVTWVSKTPPTQPTAPVYPEFEKQHKDTKHLRGQVIAVWAEITERIKLSCMYLGYVICALSRDCLLEQLHPRLVGMTWENPLVVGKELAAQPTKARETARAQEMCHIDVIRLRIQDMVNASCNCRTAVHEMDAFIDAARVLDSDKYMELYTKWVDISIYSVYLWCCENAGNVLNVKDQIQRSEADYLEVVRDNPLILDEIYSQYKTDVRIVDQAALHGERDVSQLDITEVREKRIVNGVSFTTEANMTKLYAYSQKDPFVRFKIEKNKVFEYDYRLRHSYAYFTEVMDEFCKIMYKSSAARLKREQMMGEVQVGFSIKMNSVESRDTAPMKRLTRKRPARVVRYIVHNPELYEPFLVKGKRVRCEEAVELTTVNAPAVELCRDRFDLDVQDEAMCVEKKRKEETQTPVDIWPGDLDLGDGLLQPLFNLENSLPYLEDYVLADGDHDALILSDGP